MISIIRDIKSLKGGMPMEELRGKLEGVIDRLAEGKCPTKTAHEIHLTAHRIGMLANAECRMAETFGLEAETEKVRRRYRDLVENKTSA